MMVSKIYKKKSNYGEEQSHEDVGYLRLYNIEDLDDTKYFQPKANDLEKLIIPEFSFKNSKKDKKKNEIVNSTKI